MVQFRAVPEDDGIEVPVLESVLQSLPIPRNVA